MTISDSKISTIKSFLGYILFLVCLSASTVAGTYIYSSMKNSNQYRSQEATLEEYREISKIGMNPKYRVLVVHAFSDNVLTNGEYDDITSRAESDLARQAKDEIIAKYQPNS